MAVAGDRTVSNRHRVRQLRARIVELARAYRVARQTWEGARNVMAEGGPAEMEEEDRCFEALQAAQVALFAALEELELLQGEGACHGR